MREIKFRAWDGKKIIYSLLINFDDEDVSWLDQELGGGNRGDWKSEGLMEFTGLSDKNGLEIYEGDLVLVRETRVCEVIFHKDAGCWDLVPRNIISSVSIGAVSPASYKYHAEVIGNIHSNPELLNR